MKVLYVHPSLASVYAARFVYEGLKNAFVDMGHEFRPYTANDDLRDVLTAYRPDIFLYSLNPYHLRFLSLTLLKAFRREGMVVFCQIRSWHHLTYTPTSRRVSTSGLKNHTRDLNLIASGLAGDVFWHWFEQDEPLMDGFSETTGRRFETIHLAADRTLYYPEYDERLSCDLAYVGSYLPSKRPFLKDNVLPLRRRYDVRLYGSDWTFGNRILGHVQRAGQFFGFGPLEGIRKLGLSVEDERRLYSSARICLNVHEEHQRRTGSDINERTFKVLACGGFQLCDNVRMARRFFTDSELVIADDGRDWFEKIHHYLHAPGERAAIADAGRRKVLAEHTYHQRAQQILDIAASCRANR